VRSEGRLEVYPAYALTSMRIGDVYRTASQGGGGYGDPLDRDPERVARDVESGLVSVEWARRVYGVALDQDHRIDRAATAARRQEIRQTRREVAGGGETAPVPEPWDPRRQGMRLSEALFYERGPAGARLRCRYGHVLGGASTPPKRLMALASYPVQVIGPEVNPHAVNGVRFELREFYCPACWTRLEVEVARPDDPTLDDASLSPAWIERRP
jgi:N-methylhydantoinase B